ncbi:MAG: hypothetical protein ACPLSY_03170 [Moorellaceae bacterium]
MAVADAGADVGAVHWPVLVRAADEVLLVSDCDEKAIFRVRQFLARHGPAVAGKCRLIVNQREERSRYRPIDVVRAFDGGFGFTGAVVVPFSREAAKKRTTLVVGSKDPAGKAVAVLAAELVGAAPQSVRVAAAPEARVAGKAPSLFGRLFGRDPMAVEKKERAAKGEQQPQATVPDYSPMANTAPEEVAPPADAGQAGVKEGAPLPTGVGTVGEAAGASGPAASVPAGDVQTFKILILGRPVMNASPYIAARGWRVVLDPADGPDVILADDRGAKYAPQGVPLVVVTDSPAAVWLLRQSRPDAAFAPTVEEALSFLESFARERGKEEKVSPFVGANAAGDRGPIGGTAYVPAPAPVVAEAAVGAAGEVDPAQARQEQAGSGGFPAAGDGPEGAAGVAAVPEEVVGEVSCQEGDRGGSEAGIPETRVEARQHGEAAPATGTVATDGGDGGAEGTRARPVTDSPPDAPGPAPVVRASSPDGGNYAPRGARVVPAPHTAAPVLAVPRHGALFVVCPSRPALAGEAAVAVLRQVTGRRALVCAAPNSQAALVLGIPMEKLVLADWRIPGSEAPVEHAGILVWAVDPYKFLRVSDVSAQRLVDEISPRFELTVVDCGGDLSLYSRPAFSWRALIIDPEGPPAAGEGVLGFWLRQHGGTNVAVVGSVEGLRVEVGEKEFLVWWQ